MDIKFLISALITLLLLGCGASTETIRLDVYPQNDPNENFSKYSSFLLLPTKENDRLTEKNLLYSAGNALKQKGYRHDNQRPDYIITLNFGINEFQEYVPPSTKLDTEYTPPEVSFDFGNINTNNYFFGNTMGSYTGTTITPGKTKLVTKQTPGYYQTKSQQVIAIFAFDTEKVITTNGTCTPFWQNIAAINYVESGFDNRFDKFGPFVIKEMISDFPVPQNSESSRVLRIESSLIN